MPSYNPIASSTVQRFGRTGFVKKNMQASSNVESLRFMDSSNLYEWAAQYVDTDVRTPHSYFDYFFSGQDIKVMIDGLDTSAGGDLPIVEFAYNIEQSKQPLYGYWSYAYDYMMAGTRIVTGAFSILTKSPDYMTNIVAKAASDRVQEVMSTYQIRGLDEDESNIEKYWGRNSLDSNLDPGQKHLFSTHPPFNFVVLYGVQDVSLQSDGGTRLEDLKAQYGYSTAYYTDVNERLVDADPSSRNRMRLLIENVQLTKLQQSFVPDGSVLVETYGFVARDIRHVRDINDKAPRSSFVS